MAIISGDDLDNVLPGTATQDFIFGNGGNDMLFGNGGNDFLYGGEGHDHLFGGTGADTLTGGTGNDTYYMYSDIDAVVENVNEGIDSVVSSFDYQLVENVENLQLSGTAIHGFGNGLDNQMTGNGSDNIIWGYDGHDYIWGGGGNDTLYGGIGNDNLFGDIGWDTMIGGVGNDTYSVDSLADTVTENAGEGMDTVNAKVTHTLTVNVERLFLMEEGGAIAGFGNLDNNLIVGNSSNNFLNGGAGHDNIHAGGGTDTLMGASGNDWLYGTGSISTLKGGADNDTYIIDGNDTIVEDASAGTDFVRASFNYTLTANVENLLLLEGAFSGTGNELNNVLEGNSAANTLTGGLGQDTLDGKGGIDTLVGGLDNDLYKVDAGDIVSENFGEGTDTVQSAVTFALAANVEVLTLTGSAAIDGFGNASGNTITGNSGANVLAGLGGADILDGGAGIDTASYAASGSGVNVNLENHTGTGGDAEGDTLIAIENVIGSEFGDTLFGFSNDNVLNGMGGVDTLVGGEGADTLIGGTGADNLYGGAGDDIYINDGFDSVFEVAALGIDTVVISASYTLGANVENLTLAEGGAFNGVGNELANTLTGNSQTNQLYGNGGNDTLTGGGSNDTFIFTGLNEADKITDFSSAEGDLIWLQLLDANANVAGDQDFNFIGGGNFTNTAGQLHFQNGFVEGDVDGDGAADFSIEVNQANLSASDFAL